MRVNDETALYPPRITDDGAAQSRTRKPGSMGATALRTRSPAARHLLARAASRKLTLPQLLEAARTGAAAEVDAPALCELARVVGLQFGGEDDRRDALALYELALRTTKPKRIAPRHQALHAQLAHSLGDEARTRAIA